MILSIVKTIREKLPFIWNLIEWVNGEVISILYLKKIKKTTEKVFDLVISDYEYRVLREDDLSALCLMLSMQPKNFDIFFKPHDFDIESLRKVFKNKAFLMFGVFDKDKIIGYFFIRFFANRKAFRGKMVDVNFQGRGIAKNMGRIMTDVALGAGFRLFATISKDNLSSLASSKAVNEIRIVAELDNNYIYIEYLSKICKYSN